MGPEGSKMGHRDQDRAFRDQLVATVCLQMTTMGSASDQSATVGTNQWPADDQYGRILGQKKPVSGELVFQSCE